MRLRQFWLPKPSHVSFSQGSHIVFIFVSHKDSFWFSLIIKSLSLCNKISTRLAAVSLCLFYYQNSLLWFWLSTLATSSVPTKALTLLWYSWNETEARLLPFCYKSHDTCSFCFLTDSLSWLCIKHWSRYFCTPTFSILFAVHFLQFPLLTSCCAIFIFSQHIPSLPITFRTLLRQLFFDFSITFFSNVMRNLPYPYFTNLSN